MKNIDILAIGDTVIDAFIKLKDAEVHCDIDMQNCMLSVRFGDKVPYESVEVCYAVGNSANAAVSAARLGLNAALYSYVGNDQNGAECLASLQKNNVDTSTIEKQDGKKTNYHYVLWYDVDRTILVKHEHFDYNFKVKNNPKWIYLSSLGDTSYDFHIQIADYLDQHPDVKLAFQPGTFQMKMGKEKLERIYKRSDIFFCNVEEAQLILGETSRDIPTLLHAMNKLGPKIVVITDGFAGAYAYDPNTSSDILFMPIYPHTPYERTGAGDAFASTIVSVLAMGKSLHEGLLWAPVNSMSVVLQVGAQKGLLSQDKIKEYLTKAPEDYKLGKL